MSNPQYRQFIEGESNSLAAALAQGQTHEAADRLRQEYNQMVRGGSSGFSIQGEKDFEQLVRLTQAKEQQMLMQGGVFLHPARIAEERVQVPGPQGQLWRTMMDVRVFGPDDRPGFDPSRIRNTVIDVGVLPTVYGAPVQGAPIPQRFHP